MIKNQRPLNPLVDEAMGIDQFRRRSSNRVIDVELLKSICRRLAEVPPVEIPPSTRPNTDTLTRMLKEIPNVGSDS